MSKIKKISKLNQLKNAPKSVRYEFYVEKYLSYVNNFVSIEMFAKYYSFSYEEASIIIKAGKMINELRSRK